ncbi:lytic transglycosylase, catalytic [Oceaniovalibus guishaninsula JLT2003]|uniref:Lytic transglycosylase, catalytic n=1 Tax=Oceaniovalibus guishaninsula JLT2003 TaxID=1231392 RepID=K2HMZ3_9RHOB|nr:lytic transglycosylase domain-containing protein [Oceaniovalibus guishaninsula]EKE44204.1 lytic transglycosylase, catalytic [Oceaniovalibus guishaninsula JLT2003]
MRLLIVLLLSFAPLPLPAQGEPPPGMLRPAVRALPQGLADALPLARRGYWLNALAAAERAGPVARDVIEWQRLRAGAGDLDAALAFLRRNPDWPGLDYLRERTEASLPAAPRDAAQAADVVALFDGAIPKSGKGMLALIAAFRALDRDGDAQALAALAWLDNPLDTETEGALRAIYPDLLAGLDGRRLDGMLWQGASLAAGRAARRVPQAAARLAEARLALRAQAPSASAAVEAVPPALADDPGLAYERFRWRLAKGRRDEAIALLRERSVSAESLGRPERWADHRGDLARRLMREGRAEDAYLVASTHWLTGGGTFADLEWLSGYLALTYLDQPERAEDHFARMGAAVATPISLGRAGYWLGRARDAKGDAAGAAEAWRLGARYQSSFYGLLAAEAAGLPLDPALAGREEWPPVSELPFRDSSVLAAGLALQRAGDRDLAERFLTHLAESLTEAEAGSLADLALSLDEPHIALMIAKRVADRGITLPRAYYPVIDLGVAELPVDRALALSIARRESEFDPTVRSPVGAAGLMQVMPATAAETARKLGLPYSEPRLFADPVYNATLGSAYLRGLIARFGPSPVLVAAGYNAGPSRPAAWIEARGDPRTARIDVVDWIEHVPFDETRNYIMRVAESLPVYRARLTGQTGALEFTAELKGAVSR